MPDNQNQSQQNDITLDNVLNTGEDTDRKSIEQPASTDTSSVKSVTDTTTLPNTTVDDSTLTPEQVAAENKTKINTLLKSYTAEDTLTDEHKTIRTQLLTKFKGSAFDSNGNIVDEQGNIVTDVNAIYDYISDDKVTLDAKGNQIDTDGNIVKSAYDIAVEETVVNKLAAQSGYIFKDEEGNPKIYSDDDAGIKEFTNDLSAQRFIEFKQEFFGQNKELTEIAKHILGGGTLDTFKQNVDYDTIDNTKLSKEDKLSYIKQSFLESGLSAERTKGLIDLIVNSNNVEEEYTKAINALKEGQTARDSKRDADYQAAIMAQQAEVEQYWNSIEDIVQKGTLNDITIPEEDREGFYAYLAYAVDDKGNSQDMLDSQKETKEQKLMSAYWRFKGYDWSKVVNEKVKTEKVKGLRQLITHSANLKNAPINDAKNSKTSGEVDITISSLLG